MATASMDVSYLLVYPPDFVPNSFWQICHIILAQESKSLETRRDPRENGDEGVHTSCAVIRWQCPKETKS